MSQKLSNNQVVQLIPLAFYNWNQVRQLIPVSREYWRQLRRAGKAPEPIYFAGKALWRGHDLITWLRDPYGYDASKQPSEPPAFDTQPEDVMPYQNARQTYAAQAEQKIA